MFTNALMEHECWILKGGTNLLCRLRNKVTVLDGTTTVESFNIDLSADIVLNAEPDVRKVPRGDTAVLPGYPAALRVRRYPIENQIADKLSAIFAPPTEADHPRDTATCTTSR